MSWTLGKRAGGRKGFGVTSASLSIHCLLFCKNVKNSSCLVRVLRIKLEADVPSPEENHPKKSPPRY